MDVQRFVVLGDSCAEGIDDPYPDGSYRGWADMVAKQLAVRQPGLRYANLAVRGRRLDQIHAEQLPTACELLRRSRRGSGGRPPSMSSRPDLVALFGGGNDVLQGSRWDAWRVRACLHEIVGPLSRVAGTVVLFTLPESRWRLRLRQRVELLNAAVESIAAHYGAVLCDLREDDAVTDRRYFGADRLHLSEHGHRRLAAHVLRRLDVPRTEQWDDPLPDAPPVSLRERVAGDLRWLREIAAPAAVTMVRNRLVGRQPGDGFAAKRPELSRVAEQ